MKKRRKLISDEEEDLDEDGQINTVNVDLEVMVKKEPSTDLLTDYIVSPISRTIIFLLIPREP